MTTKEEVKKYIKNLEFQIQQLENDKFEMVKKLKEFPLTKAEQLDNVLKYGRDSSSYLDGGKFIEDYLNNCNRYETIEVKDMICSIFETYKCETFEDQKEVEELFGESDFTIEQYENHRKYFKKFTPKELFFEFADDIIKENIKSFQYDW